MQAFGELPDGGAAAVLAGVLIERLRADSLRPSDPCLHLAEQAGSLQRMANALQNDALLMHEAMMAATERIHKLESELAQARALSCEDALTGCLNRRGLERSFLREAARAARTGQSLCVAILDLDDFKKINDAHGHGIGDRALVHLVELARTALRASDSMGRWGGEEFVLVLPDTSLAAASLVLSRLQKALRREPLRSASATLPLSFSAGVCRHQAGEDCAAVVQRADRALYIAKKAGKDRVIAQ